MDYEWLSSVESPKILVEAIKLLGTRETPGKDSNQIILEWAKEVGYSKLAFEYSSDEIPWCGLFLSICTLRAGFIPPKFPLRALSWSEFGTTKKHSEAMLGDVLTFSRKGGGHVGLYVGEDVEAFHVLGGNQKDTVSVARILKSRLYGVNRCNWKKSQPASVRKIWLDGKGRLSENEV